MHVFWKIVTSTRDILGIFLPTLRMWSRFRFWSRLRIWIWMRFGSRWLFLRQVLVFLVRFRVSFLGRFLVQTLFFSIKEVIIPFFRGLQTPNNLRSTFFSLHLALNLLHIIRSYRFLLLLLQGFHTDIRPVCIIFRWVVNFNVIIDFFPCEGICLLFDCIEIDIDVYLVLPRSFMPWFWLNGSSPTVAHIYIFNID